MGLVIDMKADRDDLTTRFLLGELSETEQREVEERFLSDNEFFEQILASEDELIEQYLSGSLKGERYTRAKALFEASHDQRQNVDFTKELAALVKSGTAGAELTAWPSFRSSFVQRTGVWLVVAFVAVLLGSWTAYLIYLQSKLKGEQAAVQEKALQANLSLNAEIARRNQLIRELEAERGKREQAEDLLAQSKNTASFTEVVLRPAAFERSQGSTLPTFKVRNPQLRIQLILNTDRKFEKYQLTIATLSGEVRRELSMSSNRLRQGRLMLTLPSEELGFDDFRIELRGASTDDNFERIADYAFRLTR